MTKKCVVSCMFDLEYGHDLEGDPDLESHIGLHFASLCNKFVRAKNNTHKEIITVILKLLVSIIKSMSL